MSEEDVIDRRVRLWCSQEVPPHDADWLHYSHAYDRAALLRGYAIEFTVAGSIPMRLGLWPLDVGSKSVVRDACVLPGPGECSQFKLCRLGEAPEATGTPPAPPPRWPFFVEHPLEFIVAYKGLFWVFEFAPGWLYEERHVEEALGVSPASQGKQVPQPQAPKRRQAPQAPKRDKRSGGLGPKWNNPPSDEEDATRQGGHR